MFPTVLTNFTQLTVRKFIVIKLEEGKFLEIQNVKPDNPNTI